MSAEKKSFNAGPSFTVQSEEPDVWGVQCWSVHCQGRRAGDIRVADEGFDAFAGDRSLGRFDSMRQAGIAVLKAVGLVAVLAVALACESQDEDPYPSVSPLAAARLYVDRACYLEGYVAGLQDAGAAPRPAGGAK